LARLVGVEVHCFGGPRQSPLVKGTYAPWEALGQTGPAAALQAVATDLRMAAAVADVDLVHSHTWYANLGGHLAKLMYGSPHVMTAHSLEPLRPWKAEQLGGGYAISSFCERTSAEAADMIIAVSGAMADDIMGAYPAVGPERVTVIHNGIDPEEYQPDPATDVLEALGVDPGLPTVIWIGRVTAQKGIGHLLDMAALLPPEVQLVFLAGAADTPELGEEMSARAGRLAGERPSMHWIEEMVPRRQAVQLLSHATVFVCPSVYEPFGLINLEAMACGLPVVATAVGGIPEIVVEGVTGHLVPVPEGGGLGAALAEPVAALLADPGKAKAMGAAGRQRVLEHFTWESIAHETARLYSSLL
jgi:starch synthase